MTQADSALALRRSLDSDPTPGQGQALPHGWGFFRSTRERTSERPHWYAVSPFAVDALKAEYGRAANGLFHTVHADTWEGLLREVKEQVDLLEGLTRAG